MELFTGNSHRVKSIDCFRRGAPSLMFDRILNVTLSDELLTTGVTQGNLDIPLLPKSLDSVEILDRRHILISFKENSSTG